MAGAALARCVGDVDAFLTDVAGLHPHRHRDDGFDDLLSLDDVDDVLTTRGLRHPAVRLVQDGEPVPRSQWTRRARTGSVWIDDLVDAAKVLDLHADGATIVLQSLQRWWPAVGAFCRELEASLGHAIQANAYLTPAGAAGLLPHHDTHDVFVLQIYGSKSWVVREPYVVAPLPDQRSDAADAGQQPIVIEASLTPGDCLYLPRGFVHSARAQSGTSLHLTVGVLATTGHDVLRRIVDAAASELPSLRRAVPALGGTGVSAAEVKALVGELTTWLDRVDVTAFSTEGRPPPTASTTPQVLRGRLLDLAGVASIDDATRVVRVEPIEWQLDTTGDQAMVVLADREIRMPSTLGPALARLLDGAGHAVADLGDLLDDQSRLVLVRRLVREGALSIVA